MVKAIVKTNPTSVPVLDLAHEEDLEDNKLDKEEQEVFDTVELEHEEDVEILGTNIILKELNKGTDLLVNPIAMTLALAFEALGLDLRRETKGGAQQHRGRSKEKEKNFRSVITIGKVILLISQPGNRKLHFRNINL